ncbi:MAG: hypothetical protein NUW01_13765 [Gemmatimonadaceae bacterium]|nr:hypothetical protein [Gemmatimonadaceae bacterium]
MAFVSGRDGVYWYTADARPRPGDVIRPDTVTWQAIVTRVEPTVAGEPWIDAVAV